MLRKKKQEKKYGYSYEDIATLYDLKEKKEVEEKKLTFLNMLIHFFEAEIKPRNMTMLRKKRNLRSSN